MPSHFRVKALAVAIGVATATSICAMPAVSAGNAVAGTNFVALTQQHAAIIRQGDAVVGTLAASQPIHIEVALKMRNQAQLKSFIKASHTSNLQMVQRTLTTQQFVANYAPSSSSALLVVKYLEDAGFTNVTLSPNRLMISADGRADTAQAAFKTTFSMVRTKEGRMAYMHNGDVQIPVSLQETILSVIGLQSVHQAHTFAVVAQSGYTTQAVTGHNPTEFASIYGGSGVSTAAGVPVGIVTQGNISQTITDLNTFTSQNGLATVTTQTVNTNGTSSDTSGLGEWSLDSQDVVGMAGGQVGKLIFYNIPTLSNANLTADFNTIVSANATKIINVSLGECETSAQGDGSAAAQDQIFQQAVAQGQTFSISTGDSGADECSNGGTTPSWPAASQYVVAVGGTTLNASTTTWSSATVWSGGGGSSSTFEPQPSWQNGVAPGSTRGLPDIAYDADPNSGSKVIVSGATQQIGGTSLSAPLFAGTWARIIAIKGSSVGFAAPLLYKLAGSAFHDITSGSNGGESASVGYDLASGRGEVIISAAASGIGGGGGGGGSSQLITNGGFETGLATPWTLSSGILCNSTCSGETAHAGSWFVWLDGYGSSHTDTASQQVTIPSGKTTVNLSYYLHIDTAETTTSSAYDKLSVQVFNGSGTLLKTLATFSNLNAATGYTLHSSSLAAYAGQTVTIKFTGTEDTSLQTSFVLDDVSLTAQ